MPLKIYIWRLSALFWGMLIYLTTYMCDNARNCLSVTFGSDTVLILIIISDDIVCHFDFSSCASCLIQMLQTSYVHAFSLIQVFLDQRFILIIFQCWNSRVGKFAAAFSKKLLNMIKEGYIWFYLVRAHIIDKKYLEPNLRLKGI